MDDFKPLAEVIDAVIANIKRCYICDSVRQPMYEFHIKGHEQTRFYCDVHAPRFGRAQAIPEVKLLTQTKEETL